MYLHLKQCRDFRNNGNFNPSPLGADSEIFLGDGRDIFWEVALPSSPLRFLLSIQNITNLRPLYTF